MRRPQFSLKTFLWLMVCVACFFAGMACKTEMLRREQVPGPAEFDVRQMRRPDGTVVRVIAPVQSGRK